MPAKLALMFAAGLAIAATSFDARAMPSSPAGLTRQQNDVTLSSRAAADATTGAIA